MPDVSQEPENELKESEGIENNVMATNTNVNGNGDNNNDDSDGDNDDGDDGDNSILFAVIGGVVGICLLLFCIALLVKKRKKSNNNEMRDSEMRWSLDEEEIQGVSSTQFTGSGIFNI